ncbi:hypothetical protein PR202_gb10664 [Eleusine coracana subsp. coracana]|uniref:Bifunctional inhibitor/plant lipid transfer protein/seed storage helical domain-containing protein n=1 Tax=Eleusine coracana subsp. coracana TaxID=191504 RepID=A0AAV5EL29_ELECO|nr:hypothetical protein PR202_gb10664 [Eleusine coracana subsp. coracana]
MMGGAAYDVAVRGGLALAVAAGLLASRCAAQAPSSGTGCMPELVSLSPCMAYMSGNLSDVLRSSPRCLCMVLGGTAASLGVAIDSARAMQLPGACKVQAPPASQCNGSGSKATPTPVTQYSDGSIGRPRMIFVFVGVSAMTLLRRF